MKCIAHTKDGKNFISEDDSQTLEEHLLNVSKYAKKFATDFGASEAGELVGILHDYGKYSEAFQEKIRGERTEANHAMAGAKEITKEKDIFTSLYGLIIAGHHTGMDDFKSGATGYKSKLDNYEKTKFHEIDKTILQTITKQATLKQFKRTKQEKEGSFAIACYLKMLFSSLVDADFTDTEEFCSGIKREKSYLSIEELEKLLTQKIPKNDGREINNIRESILEDCMKSAKNKQGLFSLTVPTGGGKTISSLAFALKHAKKHGLSKIIYVIPYTSIIEQNAKVFKDILGSDSVLEHHSNIITESDDFKTRWATENWDIPVIVTTNVQFFESFFSNKPSKNRKLHNLANSVIIFDEAQMLPTEYLSPCLYAISELVLNYNVTTVLCSATQPELKNYIYKDMEIKEIVKDPIKLANSLKRVKYEVIGEKSDDEIISKLLCEESGLVIVNSKFHAYSLYEELKSKVDSNKSNIFCLSTLIPGIKRSEKIKEIKEKLKNGDSVYVISTQLIEAGVDVDFPSVFRSIAGIDSIIQAGGRANREGKKDFGYVYVFEPLSESGKIPPVLENNAKSAKDVIKLLDNKAFELEGIKKYFESMYSFNSKNGVLDEKKILDEFELKAEMFNFKTVAEKFKIIKDNTIDLIIPLDIKSQNLVKELRENVFNKKTIRELSKYSVSIYSKEFKMLSDENSIENINNVYVLNNMNRYKEDTGLNIFSNENFNGEACFL